MHNERTRDYRLAVKRAGAPVMKLTIPAPSKQKAILYCQNRWPGCTVEAIK
jgi:hypothetical protein